MYVYMQFQPLDLKWILGTEFTEVMSENDIHRWEQN
jgi:hypothetical protein